MKNSRWILIIGLAASAWAQSPALKPQTAPQTAAKPSTMSKQMAANVVTPPSIPALAKAAAQKPSAAPTAIGAVSKPAVNSAPAPATNPVAASSTHTGRKGQRDPFVSPIAERPASGPACSGTGKRCLYVSDLNLVGIVESDEGVLAVVTSGSRTYFLREHDPLADGDVQKITRDAITMRQRSSDLLGRPVVREVVRKLGGPAV
jgi:hypothetical protein